MKRILLLMAFGASFFPLAYSQDEATVVGRGIEQEHSEVSLVVGYVSKQWASKVNGSTYHENLWGERNKRLHGLQGGFAYTPKLPMGLGVYTGLMAEWYFSLSDAMGYDEFAEFSFHVPIHANFDIRFSPDMSLNLQGGFGLDFACHGGFTNEDAYYIDYKWSDFYDCYLPQRHQYELDHIRYGKDGWPKRFNASLEFSIGLKIRNKMLFSAGYSWGLLNHRFYRDMPNSNTRQDKLSICAGFEF